MQIISSVPRPVNTFSPFSGDKTNCIQCEAIPLTVALFLLTWVMHHSHGNLMELNTWTDCLGLLQKVRDDIKRWSSLSVSAEEGLMMMNILPRLSFIISALPVHFPTGCNKKPKISLQKLSLSASHRRRERKGYHFSAWSEGWSEYQSPEALGKERQPSELLLLRSEEKTQMRHVRLVFSEGAAAHLFPQMTQHTLLSAKLRTWSWGSGKLDPLQYSSQSSLWRISGKV